MGGKSTKLFTFFGKKNVTKDVKKRIRQRTTEMKRVLEVSHDQSIANNKTDIESKIRDEIFCCQHAPPPLPRVVEKSFVTAINSSAFLKKRERTLARIAAPPNTSSNTTPNTTPNTASSNAVSTVAMKDKIL